MAEGFSTKEKAEQSARHNCQEIAKAYGVLIEHRIKDQSGVIRESNSYPRSLDPRTSKG